ncbi:hypothetical protein [Ornithinimicrobium kibberense]|uniref:hypothetical protein n=1 Tax=Ornithinimicrobium kibberense TaxID=282060 RepID=UPI003622C1AE
MPCPHRGRCRHTNSRPGAADGPVTVEVGGAPRSPVPTIGTGGARPRARTPTAPSTESETTAWPSSPCASSSRAASTSGTRPVAGTPR